MFGWLTGFWQVFFVTAVFCLWNKIRSSNMNCHGLVVVQMSTMTACNENTFKGNLFIMLAGLCLVWLTPIYKRIVYNECIRQNVETVPLPNNLQYPLRDPVAQKNCIEKVD
jgi:hypothetical protein